ncbi:hypothetical protein [uncultured Aliiroseovarius sp.]|uniref:hypothetical protein n=1 Tax=uncultured Aliiroseovarius sp. TaxID=1658783 RepID=UPI00259186ED|nr:hypothetical protein [uncultured Aliiroseovarius sp.]
MYIDKFLPTARRRMCSINLDAALLQATRLLESDHDILPVCAKKGQMAGILTKSDVDAAPASAPAPVAPRR